MVGTTERTDTEPQQYRARSLAGRPSSVRPGVASRARSSGSPRRRGQGRLQDPALSPLILDEVEVLVVVLHELGAGAPTHVHQDGAFFVYHMGLLHAHLER